MTLTSLLVHVEADATADCRLAMAVDLANQFDAMLIGIGAELYRLPSVGYDGDYGSASVVSVAAAEVVAELNANLALSEQKFRAAAAAVRQGSAWRAAVQFPVTEIAAQARAADLVVTSLGPLGGGSDYSVAAPGALALQAGRPVLAAPPQATSLAADKVLVAWKDTRECRRALCDAIPFLKRATAVTLTEIVESCEAVAPSRARLADVAAYLARHGVKSEPSAAVAELGVTTARQLLEIAGRDEADLIVAGGYGHTRFQEWVFGGVTRALLAQISTAVLLSH